MIDADRNVANDALLNAILLDSTNGRDVANDMGVRNTICVLVNDKDISIQAHHMSQ